MKFGRLIVLHHDGFNNSRQAKWKCMCACGETNTVVGSSLLRNLTRSCGCLGMESRKTNTRKHGYYTNNTKQPELEAYYGAKKRCTNPKANGYSHYGGRGIEFRFESFEQFIKEVGNKPSPKHSIDRIDNNGHYEPGNIRWTTQSEQVKNQRRLPHYGKRTFNAVQMEEIRKLYKTGKWTQKELAEMLGVNKSTIRRVLSYDYL